MVHEEDRQSAEDVVELTLNDCIIAESSRFPKALGVSRPMPERPILLSLTTMHQAGLQILNEATELRMASALDPATLQREVVGADALIIRTGGVVDAALLDRGEKLRVVGRHGVGYDQIDVAAATARGVQVVYTPGANTQSVAEHVFALMIGISRHFPRMSAGLLAGNYHVRTSMTGREIAGKTLGIVGFGRIGRLVGEIAHRGFGMKVLYHDIVPAPPKSRNARTPAARALKRSSSSPITSPCTCRLTRAPAG